MNAIKRNLADAATYRRLVYLLSALALGPIWFAALVTVWSLCLGLAITPFVIPALIVLGFMTRGFAAVEAELARSLLDVDAHAPSARPARPGFWAWLRAQFGGGFWRSQAFLMIRWFGGFPVAIAVVTVLAVGAEHGVRAGVGAVRSARRTARLLEAAYVRAVARLGSLRLAPPALRACSSRGRSRSPSLRSPQTC